MTEVTIFWFRRDLRLNDNAGLYHALRSGFPVLPIFIFDTAILDLLEDRADRRVSMIYDMIERLKAELEALGSSLLVEHGRPQEVFERLAQRFPIKAIFTNHDYEPYGMNRDASIALWCEKKGIGFSSLKDAVIFEKNEVLKDDGKPYTVFTPYSRKWKSLLNQHPITTYNTDPYKNKYFQIEPFTLPRIEEIGFSRSAYQLPQPEVSDDLIRAYKTTRDFPAQSGTSRLSPHLRFGTISIRELVSRAARLDETYLNELIWREFYMMILYHFPHVVGGAFKPVYNGIRWANDETAFQAWCDGKTGIPIVDAGMRELNETGLMHNRVRMITASFLTKHLLIDWRWGEAYFAAKLLDFELASNNGGWQWAASTGCDAVPYFRVFNPLLQTDKFDKKLEYIKKWVPDLYSANYPHPIIDLAFGRARAIEAFSGLQRGE